jgi:hypothetical protein
MKRVDKMYRAIRQMELKYEFKFSIFNISQRLDCDFMDLLDESEKIPEVICMFISIYIYVYIYIYL